MRRLIVCVLLCASAVGAGWGQSFEVASVRLNKSGARGGTMEFPPGRERFVMRNMSLGALILVAYDITVRQLAGTEKLISEPYDIAAKAERPATRDEMREMLRRLLADRFRLTVRRETRALPVYALTVTKGGPKLKVGSAPDKHGGTPLVPAHAGGSEAEKVISFSKMSRCQSSRGLYPGSRLRGTEWSSIRPPSKAPTTSN
jgi:uncharacterized protein (TIGR03435 family)